MDDLPLGIALSVLGLAVPVFAFLWEFVFVGRKRLGYRIQMDTTATDEVGSEHAGALENIRRASGAPLENPSFVLVKVENAGATTIDADDYKVLPEVKVGVKFAFPGRRVAGMVITELGGPSLRGNFGTDSGLGHDTETRAGKPVGVLTLPKVPLNTRDHYKVLAILEQVSDDVPTEPRDRITVEAGVKGGSVRRTESHSGPRWPWPAYALAAFLVLVILGQLTISVLREDTPLDCAQGSLTLTGSTAIEAAMREAATSYARTCSGARFDYDFQGSANGLRAIEGAGRGLAFSDGEKGVNQPRLVPRPLALMLFSLVVHKDAGVADLSLEQVRDIYRGRYLNWKEVGGADVPIVLVSRTSSSGTRTTFQRQVLDGKREAASNSNDCRSVDPGGEPGVLRCERDTTDKLLGAVASTPGALGYAELGAAAKTGEVRQVLIAGQRPTLQAAIHHAYPFWETEYAYTVGEPAADSLTASFLRYLTNQVGKDIVRAHGNRPCDELDNPVLCRPAAG